MAFRRQDIPKTTRKGGEGEPRRLYLRYAKDRSLLPKIDLAIGYLDSMVGRRRGDLAPDAVLDLFGDPKLARCFLACLADSYRYRTPTLAEALGDGPARQLADRGLLAPADVRAFAYLDTNRRRNGFVGPAERDGFLADLAAGLGVAAGQLEEALHLDAERNAVLVRTGERPQAEDVRSRYNAMLTLSTLRHASQLDLTLPGLPRDGVEALCERERVPYRWVGTETVRLSGRRSALGSWSPFGQRVARLATGLLLLAPRKPEAHATVHLNGQPLAFALEGFPLNALRLPARATAAPDDATFVSELLAAVATARRKGPGALRGWTIRRATEPLVVDGAIAMPELLCLRDESSVALVPIPTGEQRAAAVEALSRMAEIRPVVALGDGGTAAPSLLAPDADGLVDLLDAATGARPTGRTALSLVADEVERTGWVGVARLEELFGGDANLAEKVRPLTADAEAWFVPGFGLCDGRLLSRLAERIGRGPLDVGALRSTVASAVGEGAGADALTLHLLTGATTVSADAAFLSSA